MRLGWLLLLGMALVLSGCPRIPNPFDNDDGPEAPRVQPSADAGAGRNEPGDQEAMREARRREMASRMNKRGSAALVREQYEKAIEEFYAAVQADPDVSAYHNNLGTALYRNGQMQHALAAYGRALEMSPDNVVVRVNVANTLRQLEQYQDATDQYHAALELAPAHAPAHYELGKLYLHTKDYEHALYRLNRALEIDPAYNEALLARVIVYHLTGEAESAWEDIQTLDRRGMRVNDDLRRQVMEAVEQSRARQRYQPVH